MIARTVDEVKAFFEKRAQQATDAARARADAERDAAAERASKTLQDGASDARHAMVKRLLDGNLELANGGHRRADAPADPKAAREAMIDRATSTPRPKVDWSKLTRDQFFELRDAARARANRRDK